MQFNHIEVFRLDSRPIVVARRYLFLRKAESIKTYVTVSSLHELHLIFSWVFESSQPLFFNHDIIEAESFLFMNLIFGLESFKDGLVYPIVDVSGM